MGLCHRMRYGRGGTSGSSTGSIIESNFHSGIKRYSTGGNFYLTAPCRVSYPHKGVLEPTLMFGSEAQNWQSKNESRLNVVEMRSLYVRIMYYLEGNVEIPKCKVGNE